MTLRSLRNIIMIIKLVLVDKKRNQSPKRENKEIVKVEPLIVGIVEMIVHGFVSRGLSKNIKTRQLRLIINDKFKKKEEDIRPYIL